MFKIIALTLLSIVFLFRLFVDIKSFVARKREIPAEVKDVYDEERYLTWKAYSADKLKAKIIFSIISYIISFSLIITDVYSLASKSVENSYLSTIIVLGIDIGVTTITDIIISDYVNKIKIEGKYGFNKSTNGTFVGDCIRKFLLVTILMIGLTCLFIAIYEMMGDYIIIFFSAILIVIVLFVAFLFPLLSKASNRFASLEEGTLRTRLTDLLTKNGYQVRDIKVMDASRRTTKSNAGFSGFGKTKTIILYDNILKVLTEDELVAVFAHEMGHGLHKDSLKRFPLSFINIALIVVLAWLLVKCLASVVFTLLRIPLMALSRHQEYKADEEAVKEGYADQLISGLKKLYRNDLGDLNPDPLVVMLSYSHPTLYQRIKNIEKIKQKNK